MAASTDLEPKNGLHYEYYYDDAGRLETVETPSGQAEYAYYVNGSRKTLTLPNQVTTTFIYDDLLRLDKVEHRDSGLNLLAEFDYTVGRTGKRSEVAEEIDGVTSAWQYEYDGLGRICDATRETSGSAAVVYDYQYDLVGNRTEKSVGATTTTYEYNALDQLETETAPGGVINYDYDENGNLKYKSSDGQETNYVYDARNKLKQVYQGAILDGNLAVEFAYDFSGNRYAKSTRTGQDFEHTRFLIDNNNLSGYSQTLLEYEYYTGDVEKRYEYGDDLYCEATPLPSSPVNGGGDVTNSFFLYDGLGSTRSLTNSDGEIAQSYNYHPFGEGIDQPQNPSTNHLFTGEYFDQDLSYYYLRARYYVPSIGRFTSHDPVEDTNNKLHKYLYCGNDAVNCVDWSGRAEGLTPIGYVGLIAALVIVLYLVDAFIGGVLDALMNVKRRFNEYEDNPNYYENIEHTELGINVINDVFKKYCNRREKYYSIGLSDKVDSVDWGGFRKEMYLTHEPPGGKDNIIIYTLSDGKTRVSFDKFYHFASGGQFEKIAGLGEEANLFYELWATRSGDLPYSDFWNKFPTPVGDRNKPFNPEDIKAGEAGGKMQNDIAMGRIKYDEIDLSDYFDPNINWIGH